MLGYAATARRHLTLLLALVAMLVAQPALAYASALMVALADVAFAVLYLVIFVGLCRHGWERRTGVALFTPVVASHAALHLAPASLSLDRFAAVAFHLTIVAFLAFAVTVILRGLFRSSVIRGDDVLGGVCGYILAALAWSNLYALVYLLEPHAFGLSPRVATEFTNPQLRRTLFDYFSFTTLTSIGFSDITPENPPVYSLMWLETIFGQFYMAIVVAQLIGMKMAQAVRHGVNVDGGA